LNISPDALRMRIRRGTMNGEKDETGIWHVWIDTAELEAERKAERSLTVNLMMIWRPCAGRLRYYKPG